MLLPVPNSHFLLRPPRKPIYFSCSLSQSNSFNNQKWRTELKNLSTWGIGGPCKYFVQVFHQNQLISAIRYCNEHSIRFMIIGKGSNCLFDDMGFDGCIILNGIELLKTIEPGLYRVGSGYPFNRLGVQSATEGFTGLEFAGGIPGTVGGAAYMNAGANGQETADTIDCIEMITSEGEYRTLKRSDLDFGYRSSPFQDMEDLAAITAVTFRLEFSESARRLQQEYLKRRKFTQPVGERSAGSVFRNPLDSNISAAECIDRAGLKGYRIGGAMVSKKHANFFINCGGASSQEMLELIRLVKETVFKGFGVELKEEILYVHPFCKDKNSKRDGQTNFGK
ncbi:UDP-N-acetylmuramate dehydrogenase [Abeliophyllum distichum]|uniref:UDP-N-acetylmuramate dehydrogenase n=1 Tax=Abeliophyllum distichum TaxID=126358 RepID=A0ABD1V4V4_9LAMI